MIKKLLIAALALLPITSAGAEQNQPERIDWDAYDAIIAELVSNPPYQTADRIPADHKLGRCLLEVDGETLISGPCAYQITAGGDFQFHGSHQVHVGIDYPDTGLYPTYISTDYFVQVDYGERGFDPPGLSWNAHWNEDKRSTHAQSYLGPVTREGGCYSNARTKICLWKS